MTPPLSTKMFAIKTLVIIITIPLIGGISIHPGKAQSTFPSAEINPSQPAPEKLPQSNYLGLGGVIGIQGSATALSQGTFSVLSKNVLTENLSVHTASTVFGSLTPSASIAMHFIYHFILHRRRTMSKTLLVLCSVSSFLFSNVALAQAPSIEGNWKMSFTGENINPTYTLIQRGTSLTGTFRAPIGEFPLTGIVKGNKINFSAKFKGKSLIFAGTINGETMNGVADIPMKGRRNWTASKY